MKKFKRKILLLSLFFIFLCLFPPLVLGASSIPDIKTVIQTPLEPPPNTVVNVISVIVHRNSLLNVSLFYSTNSSPWVSEIMLLIDGDNYNGTFLASIPGQAVGTRVSYYVYALDTFGYSAQSTIQNYIVTKDTKQPLISGMEIVEPSLIPITPWDEVRIRAHIADSGSGVENARLLYGFIEPFTEAERASFSTAPMELVDGDMYNGTYEGTLPSHKNNTRVWYYTEALDSVGNKGTYGHRSFEVFLSTRSWFSVSVQIAEINIKDLSATLNIYFDARLPSPFEQESFMVHAYNRRRDGHGANIDFFRVNMSKTPHRFVYQSEETWNVYLLGNPYCFPYDHYTLELTFEIYWSKIDYLQINNPRFKDDRLLSVWKKPKILNKDGNYTSEYPEVFVDLELTRNTYDRLPVVLPILALFFMLGATLFVDTKTHLRNRLTVYLTSFVFIVGFFYTLSSLVPRRFGFTVAEYMVITLTLETVALVVSSFISALLSEHHRQVLVNACTDIVVVIFVFLSLSLIKVGYPKTPLLLSIPTPDSILIILSVIYGLTIRMCLNRKQLKMQLKRAHEFATAKLRAEDFKLIAIIGFVSIACIGVFFLPLEIKNMLVKRNKG